MLYVSILANKLFLPLGTKPSTTTDSLFQDDVTAAVPRGAASSQHTADASVISPNSSPGSPRRRKVWNNLVSRAFARFWSTLNADASAVPTSSSPISKKSCQQQQQDVVQSTGENELHLSNRFAQSADETVIGSIVTEHVKDVRDVTADVSTGACEPSDKQSTVSAFLCCCCWRRLTLLLLIHCLFVNDIIWERKGMKVRPKPILKISCWFYL